MAFQGVQEVPIDLRHVSKGPRRSRVHVKGVQGEFVGISRGRMGVLREFNEASGALQKVSRNCRDVPGGTRYVSGGLRGVFGSFRGYQVIPGLHCMGVPGVLKGYD